jgi:hypothetical protein
MVSRKPNILPGKNKQLSIAKPKRGLAAKPNISAARANMVYCQTKHGLLQNQTFCRAKKQISVAKLNSLAAKPNISAVKSNMVYCQTKHFSCRPNMVYCQNNQFSCNKTKFQLPYQTFKLQNQTF